MISNYLSLKLKVTSFLLMILVVFIHSYNLNDSSSGVKGYLYLTENFISGGIALVAVPLFFIVSGFLFFFSVTNGRKEIFGKMSKRFYTLLVPFVFWSLFSLLIYLAIQSFPQFDRFFNQTLIKDFTLKELLLKVFIDPFAYQLWFLRDLIVLVIFSPLIYWSIKQLNFIIVIMALIVWFLNSDLIIISNLSFPFFIIGSWLGIRKKYKLDKVPSILTVTFLGLWLLILWLLVFVISFNTDFSHLYIFVKNTGILFGLVAFWGVYDLVYATSEKRFLILLPVLPYTFFLYGFHEPILSIIKKILFLLFGKADFSLLFIYFLAPVLVIVISLFTAHLLKRFIPRLYLIVSGGR